MLLTYTAIPRIVYVKRAPYVINDEHANFFDYSNHPYWMSQIHTIKNKYKLECIKGKAIKA